MSKIPQQYLFNLLSNNKRMLLKTCSYFIMHVTIAIIVAYIVTGSWLVAATLSIIEPSVQAIAFFFHEKIWSKNL